MFENILTELALASIETLYMVLASTFFTFCLGLPLGLLLFSSLKIKPHRGLSAFLTQFINMTRSIPFIILLLALIPFTRFLLGTSIGINAAIVPLTLGAVPFFARLVNNAFNNLPRGLIETGFAMGATPWQMLRHILLPEALPAIMQALTMTAITLVGYSAMAGTVGGGGLGDLAIRYGYQRFNFTVMMFTILILIGIVFCLQQLGDRLAQRLHQA